MARNLVFSFTLGVNLAMDQANLTNTLMIRFSLGFNSFRASSYTFALSIVALEDIPKE